MNKTRKRKTLWLSEIYQSLWFGCHLNLNHLGHRPGCPVPATVAFWPPSPSWPAAGPESPFLLSLGKSDGHLVNWLGHQIVITGENVTLLIQVYLKLSFHFVPVMFKGRCPLHSLVLSLESTLFLSKDLLVGLLQSLVSN